MLKITDNNITLTRGDTLTLSLSLTNPDGSDYEPGEGETIRFAISTGYLGQGHYELHYAVDIPTDTMQFTMPASETDKLDYKEYNYDIEITHSDMAVDTVISGKLKIVGEVK